MKNFKPFYKENKISKSLFEQNLFADEEGEEEEAEEGGEDEAEEGEADEGGDEGGEETEEAEEEAEEVPEEAKMKLGKVIDDDLEALLVDFETEARQSKKIENEDLGEGLSLSRALFESAYSEEIDLERFTSEVARLIKNYDTLLDMEDMILSKAKSFIIARYGEEAASEMENSLADNHDIEIVTPSAKPEREEEAPIAVGAGPTGE